MMKIDMYGSLKDWLRFEHKMIVKKHNDNGVIGAVQRIEGNNIGLIISDGDLSGKLVMFESHAVRSIKHDMLDSDIWIVDPKFIKAIITLDDDEEYTDIDEFNKSMDELRQDVASKSNTISRPDNIKKYNLASENHTADNGIIKSKIMKPNIMI